MRIAQRNRKIRRQSGQHKIARGKNLAGECPALVLSGSQSGPARPAMLPSDDEASRISADTDAADATSSEAARNE
jgi:hypothetical protein